MLLAAFGGAVVLATVLKYKVTVKAPATIRPVGELRIVQAGTEGQIKSIEVAANQSIQQGDRIATIDDSQLQTQKSQFQGSIERSQQQLIRLDAQIATLDQQVAAVRDQRDRTIAAAQAEFNLSQRTYQDTQVTTSTDVREAEAAVELAQEEVSRYQQLSGTGAISQIQLGEKKAALKTAQARLDRVRAVLNPSAAPVDIAREKIAQEQASGTATLATLSKEREQLLQQRVALQNQQERDRKDLKQVETNLQQTIVRAPASGIIQALTLRNRSQVVRAGEEIAQIAATEAPLQIKAIVAAQDISKIKQGQAVHMRVSACPYPDYGTVQGEVIAIAPDTVSTLKTAGNEPQASPQPATGAYEVTIRPVALTLQANGQTCPLQSGMEGSVEIVSREEAVLQFLLRRARLVSNV